MQSQEGIPQEQTADNQQSMYPDPREQWQAPREQHTYEERPYEERPYEEGYPGMDTDESWARPGEKIYPQSAGQRGIEGPLLFIILLCAIVGAGMFLGIMITWLSWLLLAALMVAGLVVIALNWRVVTIPLPLQTFQVQDHPQLIIHDGAGSISLRRGEDKVVTVAATKRVSGIGMTPENMQVQYALQDNRLDISSHAIWNLLQFGMRHLDLVITVPQGCDIQVRNGSGEVSIHGVNGAIDVVTGSGRINISDASGQLSLKTGSGSVSGAGLNGQLKLVTGSGRIEIEQTALKGNSQMKTGSGRITFTGELDPYGSYSLLTGSGAVSLTLPPHASFRLDATTGSGGVVNEFGSPSHAPFRLKTSTGSGGVANESGRDASGAQPRALLKVKTGSGTIHVRRNDGYEY